MYDEKRKHVCQPKAVFRKLEITVECNLQETRVHHSIIKSFITNGQLIIT